LANLFFIFLILMFELWFIW